MVTAVHAHYAGLKAVQALGTLVSIGLFFLKRRPGLGSGLAVVPLLPDGVVAQHHWLAQARFLDAVAMGLITPGRSSSPPPHRLPRRRRHRRTHRHRRHLCPIYLGVVVRGRWLRHRDNPQLKAFGTGATAAIALLALLWRFKRPEPYIVGAAEALGLLLH
ncbi:chromate transporter [Streptomyces sp. NPDC001157]